MTYRLDIYIGSDNRSRRIHAGYVSKIRQWAADTFPDGYTLLRGQGYYRGVSEDSILLHAFLNDDAPIRGRLEKLRRQLKQESILVVRSAIDIEVV